MIKILFSIFLITFSVFAYAQIGDAQIVEELTKLDVFGASLLSFLTGAISYLLGEASKYIFGNKFNAAAFYKGNVKPFLWTFAGGIVVIAVYVFLPNFLPFLQDQVGADISLEIGSLMFAGSVIGAILKGFINKK